VWGFIFVFRTGSFNTLECRFDTTIGANALTFHKYTLHHNLLSAQQFFHQTAAGNPGVAVDFKL